MVNPSNKTTTLLLVDVQNSFHPGGSLAIPTADEDAVRIATLIRSSSSSIDRIVATMDSHHKLHIAHPSFWVSGDDMGKHPDPFSLISTVDIISGKWKPRPDLVLPVGDPHVDPCIFHGYEATVTSDGSNFDLTKYCIEYTRRLEAKGRFQLCIWPEHCLIGSNGHNIVSDVRAAMDEWSDATGRSVEFVHKGQNLLTEMYSALAAEVPVSTSTSFNSTLFESLRQSNTLLVCGQAMSHCVNYTLRDIVENWPTEERDKIFLLTDCASPVPGFEAAANGFMKDMEESGVNLCKSVELDL
jgi:nicotinamidase/pyrazinamidase